jgi:DNA polymerase III delta prime subunit
MFGVSPYYMNNFHEKLRNKLTNMVKEHNIPHIVFYGSAGSGKKELVHFLLRLIYGNHRADNIMYVNCAQGKGIKFIREELKAFAKINVFHRNEFPFKSIILLNADFLTVEGQSALRRCIELFSKNTRFFLVVENKNKLLHPILSRFCEFYVPEISLAGFTSIYQYQIHQTLPSAQETARKYELMQSILSSSALKQSSDWIEVAEKIVESGLSTLDYIAYFVHCTKNEKIKMKIMMHFYMIRLEHRCEKMLQFLMLEYSHQYGALPTNPAPNA